MQQPLSEQRIRCPFCGERLSILLDLSAGSQSYIEDCQVCCRPIEIAFETMDGELASLRVDCAS